MGAFLGVAAPTGPIKHRPKPRPSKHKSEAAEKELAGVADLYHTMFRSNAGKDETKGVSGASTTGGVDGATGAGSGHAEAGATKTGAAGKSSADVCAGKTIDGGGGGTESATPATTPASAATTDAEDDFENWSQCGMEDDEDEWEDWVPPPRIKECLLSAGDQAKFRKMVDLIFSKEHGLLGHRIPFEPEDVVEVMDKVEQYLDSEPVLIEDLPNNVIVVADLHGQLFDLLRIFEGDAKDGKLGWEHKKYVFLGDYVDRGRQSLEIVMALFCIKMLRPGDITLLRGNHEFAITNVSNGFARELNKRYEEETAEYLFFRINEAFCYLSIAAIVGNVYFCVHGGICPTGFTRRNMRALYKPIVSSGEDPLIHDLVWSDPAVGLRGSCFNGERGSSIYFGHDECVKAMESIEALIVIRGHTRLAAGFQKVWPCLYSIFSCTDSGMTMNHGSAAEICELGKLTIRRMRFCPQRRILEDKWRRIEKNKDADDGDPKTEDDHGTGQIAAM